MNVTTLFVVPLTLLALTTTPSAHAADPAPAPHATLAAPPARTSNTPQGKNLNGDVRRLHRMLMGNCFAKHLRDIDPKVRQLIGKITKYRTWSPQLALFFLYASARPCSRSASRPRTSSRTSSVA